MPTRIRKDVLAVSGLAKSRSQPVPKRRNDCFHQQWVTEMNGPINNLLLQIFTLDSSKIEVFETFFYEIVIT